MPLLRRILLLLLLASTTASAQTPELDHLHAQVAKGDRAALLQLIKLTTRRKKVHYRIGRHHRKGRLGTLAARNVQDLVLLPFRNQPPAWRHYTRHYLQEVRRQLPEVRYYPDFNYWGVSRLQDWEVVYSWKARAERPAEPPRLPRFDEGQVAPARLDSLWQRHDPALLLELARTMYLNREYYAYKDDIQNFIASVTGGQLGVLNQANDTVYEAGHVINAFDDVALRHTAAFWARHYRQFRWDAQRQQFVAPVLVARPRSATEQLLDQLTSPDSVTAWQAYHTLIEDDINVPYRLWRQVDPLKVNHALPISWDRDMTCQQQLRRYLLAHDFPLRLPDSLARRSLLLVGPLDFRTRYQLENRLIRELTLENVSAFERLMLDYSRRKEAQHSVTRVLDIFYSRHWPALLADTRYLRLYLKKGQLFSELRVIGRGQPFLFKFDHLRPAQRRRLRQARRRAPDEDVVKAARTVLRPHRRYQSRLLFGRIRPDSRPRTHYRQDSLQAVLRQLGVEVYAGGQLDLARVDTALKYDTPFPFHGSAYYRSTSIVPLIQLLEVEYGTDLGFGPVYITWEVSHSPTMIHRARAWRRYLRSRGLLGPDAEPISFVQEIFQYNRLREVKSGHRFDLKYFLIRVTRHLRHKA